MPDETAWLIEINEPISGPIYFQLKDDDDWTANHDKALRLARREDAQQVIDYYGWTHAKPVEHMWCDGPTVSRPTGRVIFKYQMQYGKETLPKVRDPEMMDLDLGDDDDD